MTYYFYIGTIREGSGILGNTREGSPKPVFKGGLKGPVALCLSFFSGGRGGKFYVVPGGNFREYGTGSLTKKTICRPERDWTGFSMERDSPYIYTRSNLTKITESERFRDFIKDILKLKKNK